MKTTLIIFSNVIIFASCQQCYECELKDTINNTVKTESFCGESTQADEYEAAGYTCTAN